jgi:hypothetical protein
MKPGRRPNVLNRLMPIWPVNALTPDSRCPHGVWIGPDVVCGICSKVAKHTQQEIESEQWPVPENPEDRAVKQIAFFKAWLETHRDADTRTKLHIMKQIYRLEAVVNEWIQPTRYRPDPKLKGGK